MARIYMLTGSGEAAGWLHIAGFAFLGPLSLALSRISVPVTNIVLDPSKRTSPFRPHPGRRNLSAGLVALAVLAEIAGLSEAVTAYLWIAAGAGFMDRIAEGFIGREALRAEIILMMAASGFAGAGLLTLGASALGAPWTTTGPLHLVLMGGLGLGVLTVMSIAGRFHTGRGLGLSLTARAGYLLAALAVLLRALPEMGLIPWPPGPLHLLAAIAWAGGFLLWLVDYWPFIRRLKSVG